MTLPFSTAVRLVSGLLLTACGDSSPATPVTDAGGSADAGSEVPLTIGEGFKPGIAVDAAGTAYLAWYGPETVTSSLQFCRLPRGAKACDIRKAIPALGTSLTRPFVTVASSRVRVVSYRYGLTGDRFDAVYSYTSTDGGASFDAGRQIGSAPYDDAVQGPGDTISLATDAYSFGEVFENDAADATAPPLQRAILSTDHPYSGSVGLIDAATPLVVFANGTGDAQFRRYKGSGSLNDIASWSAAQDIGHDEYMHLAGGPLGLFLQARSAANTLEVRRFDGTTFGPGVDIPEGTGELPQSHLFQSAGSRFHAVWPRIAADGIRLYYATSEDGTTWKSRLVLTSPDNVASLRVASPADNVAVAAWEGPGPTVRVLTLGAAK